MNNVKTALLGTLLTGLFTTPSFAQDIIMSPEAAQTYSGIANSGDLNTSVVINSSYDGSILVYASTYDNRIHPDHFMNEIFYQTPKPDHEVTMRVNADGSATVTTVDTEYNFWRTEVLNRTENVQTFASGRPEIASPSANQAPGFDPLSSYEEESAPQCPTGFYQVSPTSCCPEGTVGVSEENGDVVNCTQQ